MERNRHQASRTRILDKALRHELDATHLDPATIAALSQHAMKAPGNSGHRGYGVNMDRLRKVLAERQSQAYLESLVAQPALEQTVTAPLTSENYGNDSGIITP